MGCPVYIRQFEHVFEYLFIFEAQIYSSYVVVTPRVDKYHDMRDYSQKEIVGSVKTIFTLAMTTIETLINARKELKAEEKAKAAKTKPHGKSKAR